METTPSYMTFILENRLRVMMCWLLTMADMKYEHSSPELHKAGQAIMSELFSIKCSEVKMLGIYGSYNAINEAAGFLVDHKIRLTMVFVEKYHCDRLLEWVDEVNEYRHEKFVLTTLPYMPNTIDEFVHQGFKIIDRDSILNILTKYQNSHPAIVDYVNLLQAGSEKDFRLIPFGKWSEGNYLSMLQFLQKEVENLKFPVNHKDTWVCEISRPIADAGIVVNLLFGYAYYDIGLFAKSVSGEEIPKHYLKKLQNNLKVQMKLSRIPDICVSFPVIKPKNRFKLAAIRNDWLFDIFYMFKPASFINIDKTVERIKICNHLVESLAKVRLSPVSTQEESINYPTLEF